MTSACSLLEQSYSCYAWLSPIVALTAFTVPEQDGHSASSMLVWLARDHQGSRLSELCVDAPNHSILSCHHDRDTTKQSKLNFFQLL